MNARAHAAIFVKRQRTGSSSVEITPIMTTLVDCLSPLLTSMKCFGLFFNRKTCDNLTEGTARGRWNLSMVHSTVVAVLLWINVIRMFSVFTPQDVFGVDLFFKLITGMWMLLCAISQSTYFAFSYSGNLDCMLRGMKLGEEFAKYSRKIALIYACLAWVVFIMSQLFTIYSVIFTTYMNFALTPITTHFHVSSLLTLRILYLLFSVYLNASWIFPHAMSFMLARIFAEQYRQLGQAFEQTLNKCDERRLSDSDIETFREKHLDISVRLNQADGFLMFHNAGAFCCQLFNVILILYILLFFPSPQNPVVLIMNIFWLLGCFSGLSLTAAGGIMVNCYVSIDTNSLLYI